MIQQLTIISMTSRTEANNTMKKTKILTILCLFAAMFITGCGKTELNKFSADWTYFAVGENESVTFTAEASRAPSLYLGDEKIGRMHDDGKDGDETADDGIYSMTIPASSDAEKTETYHAKLGDIISEEIILYFNDAPTGKELEDFAVYEEEFEHLNDSLANEEGFIPEDKKDEALSAAISLAKKLSESGTVTEYRQNEDNVCLRFASGLTYMYIPNTQGRLAAGDDMRLQILTCEPYRSDFPYVQIDDCSIRLIKELKNCTLYNMIDDDVVTIDAVKNEFKQNRIVMWYGHGSYDSIIHSAIITGEPCIMGIFHFSDFVTNRLMNAGGKIAFSSKFIEKYCGRMDGSIFYFNCCLSAKDDALANTFLNKGAKAYIGNTETIRANYARKIQEEVIKQMARPNAASSAYNTLSEALDIAKGKYGKNDTEYGGTDGAETIILGDGTARFSDAKPDSHEVRAAYSAYLDILHNNRDAILGYTWQRGYYGFGDITEDNISRPVNLADVNSDGVPELIFCALDGEYPATTSLYIYGYKNGSPVKLYEGSWDYNVGGGFHYVLFRQLGDSSLYAYFTEGDAWREDNFSAFETAADGSLSLKQLYKYSNHESNDGYDRVINYYAQGAECDADTYTGGTDKLISHITENLMMSKLYERDQKFETCECTAMTYEEVMEYLVFKVGEEAEKVVRFDFHNIYKQGIETGYLNAYNKYDMIVWNYTTYGYPATELSRVNDIGETSYGYLIADDGYVICFEKQSGEALWLVTDSNVGASTVSCFDDEGSLYICGYYGPALTKITNKGESIYCVQEYPGYMWPEDIYIDDDGMLTISMFEGDIKVNPDSGDIE